MYFWKLYEDIDSEKPENLGRIRSSTVYTSIFILDETIDKIVM